MHNSPYDDRPAATFWRSAVAETSPLALREVYARKWEIAPDDRIATAGSCFAQHITRYLRANGFSVLDCEPAPNGLPEAEAGRFGYGLFSARCGNIYTTRQLLQLLREALEGAAPAEPAWERNGRFFDAQRPGVEPNGHASMAELLDHRSFHLAAVRQMVAEMDVFIFTLGLTETWQHRASGTVYPTAPGTIAGAYEREAHAFHNLSVAECLDDMRAVLALVERTRGRPLRVLLTVSPVPLTATGEDRHVLQSTAYSKAVLRATAGQLAAEYETVDYFPSYEIVTNPAARGVFFASNLRGVTPAGVDVVMRSFFEAHGTTAPAAAEGEGEGDVRDDGDGDDVVCEEAMLDAFGE